MINDHLNTVTKFKQLKEFYTNDEINLFIDDTIKLCKIEEAYLRLHNKFIPTKSQRETMRKQRFEEQINTVYEETLSRYMRKTDQKPVYVPMNRDEMKTFITYLYKTT